MTKVETLADEAEVIVGGYAFFDRNDGVTIINLHNTDKAAFFYNDEMIENTMDDIEAFKVKKIYQNNKKYMERYYAEVF
ncbi:MAG: hypothetical protein MSA77_03470 [Selenomonadales bacterium]|nr:hypothetical protein [Selenomonadales bacterium]